MKRYIKLFTNVSNWWKHFGVKFGVNREDPVVFLLPNGIKMEVPLSLYHEFKEIFLEDCYLRGLDQPLPERPVVVDIGANTGFFCLFVARMRPGARIVCCEPIPANLAQLSRNAEINPNIDITVLPVAVYGTSGSVKLLVESQDAFTTAATVFSVDGRIPLEVPCVTLQDLFEEQNLEKIDLLKLDCEGSEYEILYRCPRKYLARVERIAMEVHKGTGPNHNMEAMAAYLKTGGFDINTAGHMLWAHKSR
ncbi:MAG TPA: FkbM family methyltransferase [Desulfobacteraceae bacterium]|jgi:FkbM family methyltransferase|nr:FkbM family methyltransferase [Desulfobacteraceae bacterium]